MSQLETRLSLINKIREQDQTQTVVSGYYDPDVGAGAGSGIGSGVGEREVLLTEQQSIIRQRGTVTAITLKSTDDPSPSGMTSVTVTFWKKKANGLYDRIGESENILDSIVALGSLELTTISFKKKITNIPEGAIIGFRFVSPVDEKVIQNTAGSSTNPARIATNLSLGDRDVDWDSQTSIPNFTPVQLHMEEAPAIMAIGDSVLSGHNSHFSYIETTETSDPETSIMNIIGRKLNVPIQNMGEGGAVNNSADGDARFNDDIVAFNPRACIISYGKSDITDAVVKATWQTNMNNMITKCTDNNIIPIILAIAPATSFNDTDAAAVRDWNATLRPDVEAAGGIFVDVTDAVGKIRASTGEKDDIIDDFDDDGTHLTPAGYEKMADAIIDAIADSTLNTVITVPSVPVLKTAEKLMIPNPQEGYEVYDSTLSQKQIFVNGAWTNI